MLSVYSVNGQNVGIPFNLQPSAISGAFSTELISSFDTEMFVPVFLPNEVNRHPNTDRFFFTDMIKYLGFQVPIMAGENGEYGHFEKDRTTQALVVDDNGYQGGGGAGVDVTFQLDPNTVYIDNVRNIKSSYARTRQVVHFQIDHITVVNARIKTVDNTPAGTQEITVTPDDSSVDLLTLLGGAGNGAGSVISTITNAYAEGSGQGTGLQQRWMTYKNQLQIIKEDDKKTGSSMTRGYRLKEVPFEYDGGQMKLFEVMGAEEAKRRFKLNRDGALLFGTKSDNFVEEDTNNLEPDFTSMPIHTTQGLYPFAMQNGNTLPYTPQQYQIGDFDTTNDILDAEAAPYNYIWTYGSPFGQEIRELLKTYLDRDVAMKYVAGEIFGNVDDTNGMATGLAVSVGFQSIRLSPSPRTFNFKHISSFDDPQMLGGASYTYKNMSLLMPYGTFKNGASTASMGEMFGAGYNGTEMPYFGYCYSAKNGYNREVETWITGAAGGDVSKYTDQMDVQRVHHRGEFGAWASAPNLFVVVHPAIAA